MFTSEIILIWLFFSKTGIYLSWKGIYIHPVTPVTHGKMQLNFLLF